MQYMTEDTIMSEDIYLANSTQENSSLDMEKPGIAGTVTGIVCVNKLGLIGMDNGLPWAIPEYTQFREDMVQNGIVVMGRKTFRSFGYKSLQNCYTIILSRDPNVRGTAGNMLVRGSVESALAVTPDGVTDLNMYVIGGAQTYKAFMPYITKWVIFHVDNRDMGDTYFPYMYSEEFRKDFTLSATLNTYDSPCGKVTVKEYTRIEKEHDYTVEDTTTPETGLIGKETHSDTTQVVE